VKIAVQAGNALVDAADALIVPVTISDGTSNLTGLAAEVDAAAVPAIDGVADLLVDDGAVSGGSRANREYAAGFASFHARVEPWRERLVCDATTSGGLLVAIDPSRAGELPGAVLGRLVDGAPGAIEVA
jgi:selenide,water dikinase